MTNNKQKNKLENTENTPLDSSSVADSTHEYNSYSETASEADIFDSIFGYGVFDFFDKDQIMSIFRNPIANHDTAIRLSNLVYTKNGIVSNSIDYMTALMCLDRVVTVPKAKTSDKANKSKEMMKDTLKTIDDKHFIRDALFTEMTNGTAFYYFNVRKRSVNFTKYMSDYDVDSITEINNNNVNIAITTLPWRYTKIVGKKNGRYVLAFNLRYFNDFTGDTLERKLKKYPAEIVKAYKEKQEDVGGKGGDWVVLDSNKTMCRKIKCKDSEPWGRSLVIAALSDVLYSDYFTDTKRCVLDEMNNRVIYETFPEGKEKGQCALTKKQQENQHSIVKEAVIHKNSRGGVSFFSVAAGTKLDSLDVATDIFDSKNESDLNDNIALDLGICASLIGAMSTGNFAAGQNNLEMITAQLYTWVTEWQNELIHVINENIIRDKDNRAEIYYFPTSFVNRGKFFEHMKSLYTEAGGSLTFLIASSGVDPDAYMSVLDSEIEEGLFEKYKPHATSWTMSEKENGRPEEEQPGNENTIISKGNGANLSPSPSDT